ncbi:YgaP-like transmembrane domain [Streptomyces chartreusis]
MERQARFVVGAVVLLVLVLGPLVHPAYELLSPGIAGGLSLSALTKTCGMVLVLGNLPRNRPGAPDLGAALAALRSRCTPFRAPVSHGGCARTVRVLPAGCRARGGLSADIGHVDGPDPVDEHFVVADESAPDSVQQCRHRRRRGRTHGFTAKSTEGGW